MPKPAAKLGRLTLAFLCLAGLAGLFFLLRCHPVEGNGNKQVDLPQKGEMAHLTMINRSPCEWQIVILTEGGGERQVWNLALDQTRAIKLASGDFLVEQTMLTDDAGPDATRRFSIHLEAGHTYRWQLVTLLSDAAENDRRSAQGKAGHE